MGHFGSCDLGLPCVLRPSSCSTVDLRVARARSYGYSRVAIRRKGLPCIQIQSRLRFGSLEWVQMYFNIIAGRESNSNLKEEIEDFRPCIFNLFLDGKVIFYP